MAAFMPASRSAIDTRCTGFQSVSFRDWLTDGYFADCGQPPSEWAIHRVVGVLEARARFDGGTPSVFIRVGHDRGAGDSAYYLDLGDPSGRAIWICADGWSVVDKPDVHFRRPAGLLPLPMPSHGRLDRPAAAVCQPHRRRFSPRGRLADGGTPAGRPVSDPRPPRRARLRQEHPGQDPPAPDRPSSLPPPGLCQDSTRDLMVDRRQRLAPGVRQSSARSPAGCQTASAGSSPEVASRPAPSSPTTSDQSFTPSGPMILNGIDEFVRRGDLIDRCVFLHLPTIDPRASRGRGRVLEGLPCGLPADPGRRARRGRGRSARAAVGPASGTAAHGRLRRNGVKPSAAGWDGPPTRSH